MSLVLFRNQELTANVVDDKLRGLYFTSNEMNIIVPSEMKKILSLFKDEKLPLLATFCFLALPVIEEVCIKVLLISELVLKASKKQSSLNIFSWWASSYFDTSAQPVISK